ncbi:Formamidopyrimidine-DNA glycosylase [uncultured virus]|nr:Formamidopyrimidine-DNA glycosylase [uncultured virus]
MPEGPEVALFAKHLDAHVAGRALTNLSISEKSRYHQNGLSDHDVLLSMLPLNILKVRSAGKKIIFELEKDISFVSSLGLEGKWTFDDTIKHGDLWLTIMDEFDRSKQCYFCDSRHFGEFSIHLTPESLQDRLVNVGPDLLFDEVTSAMWLKVVRSPRIKDYQICDFLLKQEYFSGVGNYIRAEALYRAKVRPDARLFELSDQIHQSILRAVTDVLKESYAAQGASLHTFHNFDGTKGAFQVVVYNHKVDPSGHPVLASIFEDGRNIYWVPKVQTIPSEYIPEALVIDLRKLQQSTGRGKGTYKVSELKAFAKDQGIGTAGSKDDLVKRLIAKIEANQA